MWSFQSHFRWDFEYRAQQAFKRIGLAVDPRASLIGFYEGREARHRICVEPEDGPLVAADFAEVFTAADSIFATDEDRGMIVTGEGQQALFEARSLDKSRRKSLGMALAVCGREPDRRYFVGSSRVVNDYRVFPVLSVMDSRWSDVPTLPVVEDRMRLAVSFPDELAYRIVECASTSLQAGEQPQRLQTAGRDVSADLVRLSASAFLDSIPYRLSGMPTDLLEHLDAIAAMPYEGRPATGKIRFLPSKSEYEQLLGFGSAVGISRTRQVRKLLEMSGPTFHLVSDGEYVVGLGVAGSIIDGFEVSFTGRGVWTLSSADVDLLRSVNGRATLPTPPLDKGLLADCYARLFPESSEFETIWTLVQEASRQEHGTMLVVHREAVEEAARLGGQAVPVTPELLSAGALSAATSIDGAVLISPDGQCHAIGVILDGLAVPAGDPARGARFNSGIRYVSSHRSNCLVVVVSEDGSVEAVPPLRRRVKKSFIRGLLDDVLRASEGDVDFEQFGRLEARAQAHAFYLDSSQLAELHAARERVEDYRWEQSSMRIQGAQLRVDDWMNDTYFLPE